MATLKRTPSVKTLETLAKILHILTYSRLLLKVLIRSCLFLLRTNLLKFLIVFLVRVLSRVSRVFTLGMQKVQAISTREGGESEKRNCSLFQATVVVQIPPRLDP